MFEIASPQVLIGEIQAGLVEVTPEVHRPLESGERFIVKPALVGYDPEIEIRLTVSRLLREHGKGGPFGIVEPVEVDIADAE